MAGPFVAGGSNPRSSGPRLLGGRKRDACAAVESLLAEAGHVTEVTAEAVAEACRGAGVDSPTRLRKECKALYGRYLDHCFDDRKLSVEESHELDHLREILALSPRDVVSVQDDVSIGVYGRAVAEVLSDLRIDPEEAEFLARLREELRLDEGRATRILEDEQFDARRRARHEATTADEAFIHHRTPADDFTGRSAESLEAAVQDALGKAALAIPKLHWFEVRQIRGYVDGGGVSQWYVVVQAGIQRDDAGSD